MPVTPDYAVSHQWIRELRRNGQRLSFGVYFRVPDDLNVLIGHYGQQHSVVTAAEAVGVVFNAENTEGFEILIPRRIESSEIRRVKQMPPITGWRFHPNAKGTKPCPCDYCSRGEINAKRVRKHV